MNEEFLKNLKVPEDAIKAILEVVKKEGESNDVKYNQLKTERDGLKDQLKTANDTIKTYKDMDIDGIKQSVTDWETKYNTDTKDLQDKLDKQKYEFGVKEFMNGYKFTSDMAKNGVIAEFNSKGFKFEDGKFLGADDFMKGLKESNPGAFVVENNEPGKPSFSVPGSNPGGNPGGSGNEGFNFNFTGVRARETK